MRFTGELAAIGTAVCWGSAASFTVTSGRRMGSLVLNRLRLTVAIVFLASTLWVVRGSPWPSWATSRELGLLVTSGWLGFVLGDSLYFRALVILGAGRAALLMSLAPIFAALQARLFLGEKLGPIALLGIVLTLAGLVIVLGSRPQAGPRHPEGSPLAGVVCAMTAALVVSTGHILSRSALQGGLDALSGTVIRVGAAVPLAWLLAPVQGGFARSLEALRDRIALRSMFGAALLGPCIGV